MRWESRILGDIAKITKGKKHLENQNGLGWRYLQIQDLTHNDNVKYTAENGVEVTENDVVIAWDGANAGIVGAGLNGVVGSTLARIRPTNTKTLNGKYLYRYLHSQEYSIRADRTGATIPHVNGNKLRSIPIPLPPLLVQERIATILDEADALRKKDAALLQKYDELLQSIFYDMFGDPVKNEKGWEVKKLEYVAKDEKHSIKAGPFGSSLKKEFYVSKGYKIYGQEQVIADDLSIGDYYIDEERYQKLKSCAIQTGDILISLVGTYGKISIVPKTFIPGIINPRLMKISPDVNKILPEFLKELLVNKSLRKSLENVSRGGTMDIVNVGIMKAVEVILPPIAMQQQFVRILDTINAQKQTIIAQQAQSEVLFQSLMQRAFKGELV